MDGHSAMLECLRELDVKGIRQLWHLIAPNMPQPDNDHDALCTMHYARTTMKVLPARARFYSHRFLLDHNLPSGLPIDERPKAERMFPQVASSVGIAVGTKSDLFKPIVPIVRSAMENAVLEIYDDKKQDDIVLLKSRMSEARKTVVRKLLGR
jgi:hypothetical protein